jgi:SNF2 family DNA or RNA helicase
MQRWPKEEETNNTATAARVPLTQPKMIQAILRPYQLEGLEFMVKMHELNLTMILGDEMGLVRMTRDGIPMSIA